MSTIKPKLSESVQSKITEPACAEFSATQEGNSAKSTFFKHHAELTCKNISKGSL